MVKKKGKKKNLEGRKYISLNVICTVLPSHIFVKFYFLVENCSFRSSGRVAGNRIAENLVKVMWSLLCYMSVEAHNVDVLMYQHQ